MPVGKITTGLSRRHRAQSNASSADGSAGEADSDTSIMEPDQGNVLTHIISQLRPGADLSRVVLPTFILEPRSMLERITNFMCHPEMLLDIPELEDPVDRFVSVVKFYLSGWHIRPPGVKKPLNPILGEVYSCYWDLPDHTRAYYISEQTSHHPPKSSYFYMAPDHHIRIDGTLKPRSKFLGNSAASLMEGVAVLSLLNRGKDRQKGERYWLTQPNMYARGILFGKMQYELGDHSVVRCPELGLSADIDFKTKGWVSGTYNAIGGTIKDDKTGQVLFELSGLWSDEMFIKDLRSNNKQMFFDARKAKASKPKVRPIEEHLEHESNKLWQKTAQAVKDKNHELATDEKTKIEDKQREEAAKRAAAGVDWQPQLFRRVNSEMDGNEEDMEKLEWIINATVDGDTPAKQAEQMMAIFPILKGQTANERVTPPQNAIPNVAQKLAPATASSTQTPAANPTAPTNNGADLIDFGQKDDPTPAPAPAPVEPKRISTDIQNLLESTGQKASNGPLLDFTKDLKNGLPDGKTKAPIALTRGDTTESNDAFFDAHE
ncbi:Oxysterol-binding protein [Astrocystis sublimbata]|nr:Oxysterol-binding protein [Astrocystis sublimbata]